MKKAEIPLDISFSVRSFIGYDSVKPYTNSFAKSDG